MTTEQKPYQARKRRKLCVRGCGRKAEKGKTRCWRCRDKQKAYFKKLRAKQAETPAQPTA